MTVAADAPTSASGEKPRLVLAKAATAALFFAIGLVLLVIAFSLYRELLGGAVRGEALTMLDPALDRYDAMRDAAFAALGLNPANAIAANAMVMLVMFVVALHVVSARRHGQWLFIEFIRNFLFLPARALGFRPKAPPSLFSVLGPRQALPAALVSLVLLSACAYAVLPPADESAVAVFRAVSQAAYIGGSLAIGGLFAGFLAGFFHRPADRIQETFEAAKAGRLSPPLSAAERVSLWMLLLVNRTATFAITLTAMPGFATFLLGVAVVNAARVFAWTGVVFFVALMAEFAATISG